MPLPGTAVIGNSGHVSDHNALTAEIAAMQAAWTSYTPVWTGSTTNPVIGNGSIVGKYRQAGSAGKTIQFRVAITMGSTTTYGAGNYSISLPPFALASLAEPLPLISGLCRDEGSSLFYLGIAIPFSTTTVSVVTNGATVITPTTPFTWAVTDVLRVAGTYESV
jgi:hypothetical protein